MTSTAQIAENHICVSRTLFNEGMRAMENKEYEKSVRKTALFILIVFAAAAIWLLCTGGSLIFLLGEAVFLSALLFWLIFMLPDARRRRKYKAMMHETDRIPERTTVFYQDHLTVLTDCGAETILSYDNIISCQETKNLYILKFMNNTCILLDKKGFISGDFQVILPKLKL